MPIENLILKIVTNLFELCLFKLEKGDYSVGGSIGVFTELFFMSYFMSGKKLNRTLKLHITKVNKQTFLTI